MSPPMGSHARAAALLDVRTKVPPIGVMSKAFGKTSCLVQLAYLILALEFGEDQERFMLGFSNLK